MSFILRVFALSLILANLYASPYKSDRVRYSLIKKFQQTYPNMTILHLFISPLSSPPRDFSSYKMEAIYIPQTSLRNYKGTFSIIYTNGTKERKLYYRYLLDARLPLYKATQAIRRGEIVDEGVVDLEDVKFDHIRYNPINSYYLGRYIAKRYIPVDSIITTKDLKLIPDIKRGDIIGATLYDSGIVANFSVKALQDGIVGEVIRVRKDHKKTFKAKIISKSQVEILE